MGTPDFAVPALKAIHNSKHNICAVVTNPDKPAGRGQKLLASAVKQAAEEFGYPILQPEKLNSPNFLNEIKSLNPSIMVVVAFKKLPSKLFNLAEHGAVNIHASLLPKYRGAAPIHHAVLNGDTETGLTIFQINDKIDTGNLICQKKIKIEKDDTTGSLWTKLSHLGGDIILNTLDQFDLEEVKYISQNNSEATKAPKIKPEDLLINWENPTKTIQNKIRAFAPKPGAYTTLNGKRIKIFSTEIGELNENTRLDYPGRIKTNKNKITIKTGDGILNVLELQTEGKPRMDVKSYLAGNKITEEAKCQ
tara:strand:- start:219 stop:1136 length:918 start_codon:yes stop_codon:yes gene_type:complete